MYAVKVAYHYKDESPRDALAIDVVLCDSKEDAVAKLNGIIRNDWTTEVYENGDYEREPVPLADCRGKQADPDSVRYSDWYYAEDGTLAWAEDAGYAYRGEVVELGEADDV